MPRICFPEAAARLPYSALVVYPFARMCVCSGHVLATNVCVCWQTTCNVVLTAYCDKYVKRIYENTRSTHTPSHTHIKINKNGEMKMVFKDSQAALKITFAYLGGLFLNIIMKTEHMRGIKNQTRNFKCKRQKLYPFYALLITRFGHVLLRPSTDPPEIIKKPQNQGVRVGGVASFYCAARGDPPPSIVWRKNGKKVSGKFCSNERELSIHWMAS